MRVKRIPAAAIQPPHRARVVPHGSTTYDASVCGSPSAITGETICGTPATPLRGALRIEEASRFLGVSRTRMFEMVKRGECRSFHLGRTHLVSIRELERLIAEREEAEASA